MPVTGGHPPRDHHRRKRDGNGGSAQEVGKRIGEDDMHILAQGHKIFGQRQTGTKGIAVRRAMGGNENGAGFMDEQLCTFQLLGGKDFGIHILLGK